jgi:hypothetical protein
MKDQWRAELRQRQNQRGQLELILPFFEMVSPENARNLAVCGNPAGGRCRLMRQGHDTLLIRENFEPSTPQFYHNPLEGVVSFMR